MKYKKIKIELINNKIITTFINFKGNFSKVTVIYSTESIAKLLFSIEHEEIVQHPNRIWDLKDNKKELLQNNSKISLKSLLITALMHQIYRQEE